MDSYHIKNNKNSNFLKGKKITILPRMGREHENLRELNPNENSEMQKYFSENFCKNNIQKIPGNRRTLSNLNFKPDLLKLNSINLNIPSQILKDKNGKINNFSLFGNNNNSNSNNILSTKSYNSNKIYGGPFSSNSKEENDIEKNDKVENLLFHDLEAKNSMDLQSTNYKTGFNFTANSSNTKNSFGFKSNLYETKSDNFMRSSIRTFKNSTFNNTNNSMNSMQGKFNTVYNQNILIKPNFNLSKHIPSNSYSKIVKTVKIENNKNKNSFNSSASGKNLNSSTDNFTRKNLGSKSILPITKFNTNSTSKLFSNFINENKIKISNFEQNEKDLDTSSSVNSLYPNDNNIEEENKKNSKNLLKGNQLNFFSTQIGNFGDFKNKKRIFPHLLQGCKSIENESSDIKGNLAGAVKGLNDSINNGKSKKKIKDKEFDLEFNNNDVFLYGANGQGYYMNNQKVFKESDILKKLESVNIHKNREFFVKRFDLENRVEEAIGNGLSKDTEKKFKKIEDWLKITEEMKIRAMKNIEMHQMKNNIDEDEEEEEIKRYSDDENEN